MIASERKFRFCEPDNESEKHFMNIGLLPLEHHHRLLKIAGETPACRWDGSESPAAWRARAKETLSDLLGIPEIEKHRTVPVMQVELNRVDEEIGCREIRFRFVTEEQVTVPCHLLIPKDAHGPLPVVLCLQGHSKGMHISLGRPKYPGDEETCHGGDRDFAVRAVKEGICAVAIEQRCFGECGGTEKGPDCRQAAMRAILLGRTLIGERVWDISRCIDVLCERFTDYIDPNRVMCMGNSGGGTATIYAAAMDERIKIAIPSCAVCTYADSIGAMLHCECNFVPGVVKAFDMGDLCAMTAPRSLVVVSGARDPIFPLDGAKACVALGQKMYDALGVPDAIAHVVGDGEHRFYANDAWPVIHRMLDTL